MYHSKNAPLLQSPPVRIDDPHVAVLTVPAQAEQVPVARHFTTAVLRTWRLDQDACDTAELVVAELAANAVQYGGAELTLRLALTVEDGRLHVAVLDSSQGPGLRPERDCDPCERGRGMEIVEYLTEWVRVERRPGGRCVRACMRVEAVQGYALGVLNGEGERRLAAA
ncbi:ATP-binding protein [Streptomyces sp. NPDC006458]|uniref:ATP-binding protein n=1 Tax=Streptomyces sp. NPDC006458 TaxID=3154302 RepID=UPI0033A6788E